VIISQYDHGSDEKCRGCRKQRLARLKLAEFTAIGKCMHGLQVALSCGGYTGCLIAGA
jgi:hypothetical protein